MAPVDTRSVADRPLDFAAASTDVGQGLSAETLDTVRHWTGRVSLAATLASRRTAHDLSRFLEARAGQRSGWTCPWTFRSCQRRPGTRDRLTCPPLRR